MVQGYGATGGRPVSGSAGPSKSTRADDSYKDDERKPLLINSHASSTNHNNNKEQAPSFFSSLTFAWFSPLLEIGNRNGTLETTDIASLPLPDDCTTDACMEAFDLCWADEKLRAEQRTTNEIRRRRRKRRRRYQDVDAEGGSTRMNDRDDTDTGTNMSDVDPHDMPSQPFFEPVTADPITPTQPSLARALAWAFGKEFAKAGLLKLCHDLLIFVGPLVLNQLILFLRDESAPLSRGLYLTAAVTTSQLLMSFCLRHYFFRCYLVGLRARTALVVAIYRKALVLSTSERQKRSAGEIVNLLSTDAQRIQSLMSYLHATWYSFVQIGLALYFLWRQLGPSCLAGVVIIVIMMPITRAVASWMGGKQKRLMNAKDERVELNNECLGSMKVLKMQAWEEPMYDRLLRLRQVELRKLYNYVVANSLSIMLWNAVPLLVALATFAAYTLSGHTLDVASALTSLSLFEILRFPLFMLPQIVNRMVEASVSIARIQSFLQCKEHAAPRSDEIEEDYGVRMENATLIYGSVKPEFDDTSMNRHNGPANILAKQLHEARWEAALIKAQLIEADERLRSLASGESPEAPQSSPSPLALKRISLECKPGRFVAIVGHVGSSKSSLINTILGELQLLSGTQSVKGRLALFPQTPFVMNDSLRNNITTFGNHGDGEFDAKRYERAISACALGPDLQALPGGDMTIIGEKGITLSGGQKARVACARAVYSGADVFLLDDPLAAVDAHVATHLFSDCIVKEMLYGGDTSTNKSRCSSVILVTNAVQYLNSPEVDTIIVLRDGAIAEAGSFSELSARKGLFSSFLSVLADESSHALEIEDRVAFGDEKEAPSSIALSGVRSSCSISALGDVDQPDVSKVLCPKPKLNHSPTSVHRKSLAIDKKVATSDIATSEPATQMDVADKVPAPRATADSTSIAKEEREIGHVSFTVYLSWAKAAGGAHVFVAIIAAFSCVEAVSVLSKWWLTHWSENGGGHQLRFLAIYAIINLSTILLTLGRLLLVMFAGLRASRTIYVELLHSVLGGKMSFFDQTPLGRIINRFSREMYTVDEELVSTLRSYLNSLMSVISVVFVISSVTPMFTLCLVPIVIFYLHQQNYFTTTYREIKRIDSVSRSPIYALLGETLDGVTTIRAFRVQELLANRMIKLMDSQQNAYYLTCTAQCWLAVRLELAGTLIIFFACLSAVLQHLSQAGNEKFAGLAGLSISFALSVTQSLNWTVRMASDLEASFIAVERVNQYTNETTGVPQEASRETTVDADAGSDWPRNGRIVFKGVSLRYRENLPRVLKTIDLVIPPGSKVGVVGRTGSGKSTLVVALLRLVELDEGTIAIDGIDISQLGLKKLRSGIAIIPQDPTLFSGTIRSNLDPFGEHDEARLWSVVDRVGLLSSGGMSRASSVSSFGALSTAGSDIGNIGSSTINGQTTRATSGGIRSLNSPVAEGGSNLSVGQRQLLVIARALLSQCRIVVMDEATASIDASTDARIQQVMRTEFRDATVLTIAHRINTIADSSHILGLADGKVVEFDSPAALLGRESGLYKGLVQAWEKENKIASS